MTDKAKFRAPKN